MFCFHTAPLINQTKHHQTPIPFHIHHSWCMHCIMEHIPAKIKSNVYFIYLSLRSITVWEDRSLPCRLLRKISRGIAPSLKTICSSCKLCVARKMAQMLCHEFKMMLKIIELPILFLFFSFFASQWTQFRPNQCCYFAWINLICIWKHIGRPP